MTAASWTDFERAAPEVAAAGERLLGDLAYLATAGSDGRLRIHPFVPLVLDRRLWAFILERSPKRRDLDRDGRYAIHTQVGADDEEFMVAGLARREPDAGLWRRVSDAMPYDDADETHLLYEFSIESVLWTRWDHSLPTGERQTHVRWLAG